MPGRHEGGKSPAVRGGVQHESAGSELGRDTPADDRPYIVGVEFTLLPGYRVPVWVAKVDAKTYKYDPYDPPLTERALYNSLNVPRRYVEFRGVELGRLPVILATGVDVEPATAPIFASDFHKAWEYGGWPKVVMAFDGDHLQPTHCEIIISDTTADEITRLMAAYPTCIHDPAGERLWLTRFPETDTRAASPYEAEYARWIPANPFDALLAVFVFLPEDDS